MDNNLTNVKERILYFANYKGVSYEKFINEIGMSYASFKGLAKERPINSDALVNILSIYPEINSEWLLIGKGEMIKGNDYEKSNIHPISINRKTNDSIKDIQEIPLYDIHATAGLVELFKGTQQDAILDKIRIPGIASCDGAIYVTGDSMYPLLKSGDIVLYKEINLDSIFWGEIYLLSVQIDDWNEYISVKFVQKSELGNEYVKLVSQNQHHQSKDILISKIRAIALIRASIRLHSS